MSDERDIVAVNARKSDVPALAAEPKVAEPYRMAQRALRGRWAWVVALALVAGAAGGAVGWKMGVMVYRSEGLVRIAYTVPAVIHDTDPRMPVEIFEAFLQSQQALVSSRELVDRALEDPAWKATGRGATVAVIGQFASNLKVEHKPGTDYLRISYTDPDPAAAAAAVRAVVLTYQKVYDEQQDQLQRSRLKVLQDRRKELQDKLDALRARSRAVMKDLGPGGAEQLYTAAVQQVTRLETVLTDARLALILAQGQETVPFTVQQIAAIDPVMRDYLAERNKLEDQLQQMRLRNLGENHAAMVQTQAALTTVNDRIQKHAQGYKDAPPQVTAAAVAPSPGGLVFAGQSVKALRQSEQEIGKLCEKAKQQMLEMGSQRAQIENLRIDAEEVNKDLTEITKRIEVVTVEATGVAGGLNVISTGERAIAPFLDRRMQTAGVGALGGMALPVAIFVLIGLASKKYRYSDEMETDLASRTPLLGILPVLPSRLDNPEEAADAAQCVHHIRVMLQVGKARGRKRVYLVTSASAGEGKTSLTAALGLSFAASGSRTLIIDCDLIGQRLTSGFGAEGMSGLHEALRDGAIDGHAKHTVHRGLSLLPAGRADLLHASTLAEGMLKRLLAEASEQFDVVLVDSGPILGSVEASVVAPHVDGVILTIARCQQRPMVERAVRQLDSVGATLAGVVFNRANRKDFYRSVCASTMRSVSNSCALVRVAVPGSAEPSLGPLVCSVAASLPAAATGPPGEEDGAPPPISSVR